MAATLDLIGLMAYDLHGTWESQTGFHSALYPTEEDVSVYKYPISVSWAVDYWIQHGASRSQLLLGVASYARGWKLQNSDCTKALCPTSGSAKKGVSTKQDGFLAYYEIEDMLSRGVATRYFDNDRKVPYVVTDENEWIGYEDVESMRIKLEYLKSENLRGTLLWAMDLDDITTFPLMKEIKSGLAGYKPTGPSTTSGPTSSVTTLASTTPSTTRLLGTRVPSALGTQMPSAMAASQMPSAMAASQMPSAMLSTETAATTDLVDSSSSLTDTTAKPEKCSSGYKSWDSLLTDRQCDELCKFNSEACETAIRARKCVCGGSAVNANGSELASSFAFILILLSLL